MISDNACVTEAADSQPNYVWMRAKLDEFVLRANPAAGSRSAGSSFISRNTEDDAALVVKAQVVEQIFDLVVPGWQTSIPPNNRDKWAQSRTAALRAISQIDHRQEIADNLGDTAPKLSASLLHPWVWEAAKSLWHSGHYDQAVNTVAIKVNVEAQRISGSTLTETDLFNALFNNDRVPKPNAPRLILPADDRSRTADSMRRGARSLAEACYALYRNPVAHGIAGLSEQEALEQLAVFSTLSRIIEASTIVK